MGNIAKQKRVREEPRRKIKGVKGVGKMQKTEYSVMYRKVGTSWIVIDKEMKTTVCEIRGPVGVCLHPSGIVIHHGMYVNSWGFHQRVSGTVLLKFGVGEAEEVLNQIVSDRLAAKLLLYDLKKLDMIMKACRN